MVFTLRPYGQTLALWQRAIALVQFLVVQASFASFRVVSQKTLRCATYRNIKKAEYLAMLTPVVAEYRQRHYAFWLPYVVSTDPIVSYPTADDGTECCLEISAFWDDQPDGDIRVIFAIDDGGWRAFMPFVDSFIIARDGTFVGK